MEKLKLQNIYKDEIEEKKLILTKKVVHLDLPNNKASQV